MANATMTREQVETKFPEIMDGMKAELLQIEEKVVLGYTLADAIREGSKVSTQAVGTFGSGAKACALSAALCAATARGY